MFISYIISLSILTLYDCIALILKKVLLEPSNRLCLYSAILNAPVAQLDRAPDYESGG